MKYISIKALKGNRQAAKKRRVRQEDKTNFELGSLNLVR
jgi:hypothetical protein